MTLEPSPGEHPGRASSTANTRALNPPDDQTDNSLVQRTYHTIRTRIITGQYPQGTRLREPQLAADLQVSRIPLRDALNHIETDGLISRPPRRSAVVTRWTIESVHHLFEARLAIEVAAAGYAARSARNGSPLDRAEAVLESSELEMSRGDELGFADANAHFHTALVEASGNPLLATLMGHLTSRLTWLFILSAHRDHETACREHREILQAVQSGDERLVEAMVYAHIESGRVPTIRGMQLVE